ncbi:uncharacterized protein CLUP02_13578 [Colletotrichum lupini]|uniref:Uncharacterized protein n=1 Tax=Colletotrichum lupini TaxID=145971 RepID=A0A9Q8WLV1_9PEZI|nr:uncharacterized protein CLUP02_13578 [Colletotrichum lupini]UQC88056.1 hypothetical protein CLUP02_13578 [Colletotrichum lupini]
MAQVNTVWVRFSAVDAPKENGLSRLPAQSGRLQSSTKPGLTQQGNIPEVLVATTAAHLAERGLKTRVLFTGASRTGSARLHQVGSLSLDPMLSQQRSGLAGRLWLGTAVESCLPITMRQEDRRSAAPPTSLPGRYSVLNAVNHPSLNDTQMAPNTIAICGMMITQTAQDRGTVQRQSITSRPWAGVTAAPSNHTPSLSSSKPKLTPSCNSGSELSGPGSAPARPSALLHHLISSQKTFPYSVTVEDNACQEGYNMFGSRLWKPLMGSIPGQNLKSPLPAPLRLAENHSSRIQKLSNDDELWYSCGIRPPTIRRACRPFVESGTMPVVTCRSTDALAGLGALHAHRGPSTGRTTAYVHVFEARMRSALIDIIGNGGAQEAGRENRQWTSTRRTRRSVAPWAIPLSTPLQGISVDEANLKRAERLSKHAATIMLAAAPLAPSTHRPGFGEVITFKGPMMGSPVIARTKLFPFIGKRNTGHLEPWFTSLSVPRVNLAQALRIRRFSNVLWPMRSIVCPRQSGCSMGPWARLPWIAEPRDASWRFCEVITPEDEPYRHGALESVEWGVHGTNRWFDVLLGAKGYTWDQSSRRENTFNINPVKHSTYPFRYSSTTSWGLFLGSLAEILHLEANGSKHPLLLPSSFALKSIISSHAELMLVTDHIRIDDVRQICHLETPLDNLCRRRRLCENETETEGHVQQRIDLTAAIRKCEIEHARGFNSPPRGIIDHTLALRSPLCLSPVSLTHVILSKRRHRRRELFWKGRSRKGKLDSQDGTAHCRSFYMLV